jgi:hypothetical protein
MGKKIHEICDPVHGFIKLDSEERKVVDSYPVQRLRNIGQLSFTHYLYPGATHKRFEHSLGVMELAGRVFDVITNENNINDSIKMIFPNDSDLDYWKKTLRMAALCHDLGHLPFSHSAEGKLLKGKDHEYMTVQIIESKLMQKYWRKLGIKSNKIAKLAIEPKKYPNKEKYSDWEAILSEIISSNIFGVDRMDYLLRDSYYTGVVSGKFDYMRLIDTLRILPKKYEDSNEPALGVEEGGLRSAEELLLARYFMFSQIYFHHIRRIYDLHLQDFLISMFPDGISDKVEDFLKLTDNEILVDIFKEYWKNDNSEIYNPHSADREGQ